MRNFKANGCNWFVAFLVIAAILPSASCGGTPKGKAGGSVAGLVFNTESLDFGAVSVGGSRKASITVTNSSPADGGSVAVTNIVVTGAGFSLVAPTSGFSLAPGQSSTISIKFAPKAAGNAVGQLSIFVAGTPQSGDISLTGSTIAGNQLVASPATMNFGGVTLGSSKTLTGTLSVGTSDVTVASASWSGQGYSVSGIAFPVTIQANSSIDYTVTFTPQTAGAVSGGIIFVSNATNSPNTQTFSGTGSAVAQALQHSVDLSWNSGSSVLRVQHLSGNAFRRALYPAECHHPRQGSSYTDSTVTSGTTYYYVATAIDSGVESTYSDEVVAAIPSPRARRTDQ